MTIEIKQKKTIHEGHVKLYDYQIERPSLDGTGARLTAWREVTHTHNSVAILIYAQDVDSFVMCEEFRAPVFCSGNGDNPVILQCVAGQLDKSKSVEEIARMEVEEETGLTPTKLTTVAEVYPSPGRTTEKSHVFCAEVAGTPITGLFGLEQEGEEIRTQLIKRVDIYKMMDEMKIIDGMTLIALSWFRLKHS